MHIKHQFILVKRSKTSNCRLRHQIPRLLKDRKFLEDRKFYLSKYLGQKC